MSNILKIALATFVVLTALQSDSNARELPGPPVTFLEHTPEIDGQLDLGLRIIPEREFSRIIGTNDRSRAADATYRLAYGAEFLYVYIEIEADTIISRDRAYQNGDGFHLAITAPRYGGRRTDEFYVLGFSPQADLARSWQRKFVWYHNVDLSMTRLRDAEFETHIKDGTVGMEALIPWSELYPYHPWISDAIGFNLCYVQAVGSEDKIYHFVVPDRYFQSEQSNRRYAVLRFEEPRLSDGWQCYATLEKNHLFWGDSVIANIALIAAEPQIVDIRFRLTSGEGDPLMPSVVNLKAGRGLEQKTFFLGMESLDPGGYRVNWSPRSDRFDHDIGMTVLPDIDPADLINRVGKLTFDLSRGSWNTILFKADKLKDDLQALRPYETAADIRFAIYDLLAIIEAAEDGRDILAERTGIFRRAYLSEVDNTFQPYSVHIPESFDRTRTYPLFVFLHGSGQDDRGALEADWTKGDFIELAPSGRGTSNCYTVDNAQDDIREAINDVIANYPIDTNRIVLAGFSMGGYGVYRTFYEMPERFRALAVFSGIPDLADKWLERGEHPNFFHPKYLEPFENVEMFIFHGRQDRNAPYEDTERLVSLLREHGAEVRFVVEEDKGHQFPGHETMGAYYDWLYHVIR